MILITVKTKLKPGQAEAYLAAHRPFLEATRNEPGNKWFDQYVAVDDPDTILTSEAFVDDAAGKAHVASDHFQAFAAGDETKKYVAQRPEIIYLDLPDRDGWDEMSEF